MHWQCDGWQCLEHGIVGMGSRWAADGQEYRRVLALHWMSSSVAMGGRWAAAVWACVGIMKGSRWAVVLDGQQYRHVLAL